MEKNFFEYPEEAFAEEEIDDFKKIDVISMDTFLFTSACQVFNCILEKLTYNLDKELRIIVNYDPQRKKVRIRYFAPEENEDKHEMASDKNATDHNKNEEDKINRLLKKYSESQSRIKL